MKVICIAFEKPEATIEAFAESCYRMTPDLCIRKQDAVFLEIDRCKKILSEKGALLRAQALLRRFGLTARVSVAEDLPTSLVLAKSGARSKESLPLSYLEFFADPFGVDLKLQKSISTMVAALERLGLQTLLDFSKVPLRQLVSRFGIVADICWQRLTKVSVAQSILWPKFSPPERVFECVDLLEDEQCSTLEPLLFKCKSILERLVSRTRARGMRVSKFLLEVESPKRHWIFNLYLPQTSVHGILTIIRERLASDLSRMPIEGAVSRVFIEILETMPGFCAQKNFFHNHDSQSETFSSLVGQVAEKLGEAHVFRAEVTENYLPELSWKKSRVISERDEQEACPALSFQLPYGKRPLRLVEPPQKLERKGRFLFGDQSKFWRIEKILGPEKIQTPWWQAGEPHRSYYSVETNTGEVFWIFKVEGQPGVFLHGIFE